jgi:predicted nucleotidyltransferase
MDDVQNQEYPPGEEELTRRFLSQLSMHNRINSYMTSKRYEAEIGADWLWLVFTDSGVTPFLVQAKKLHKGRQEISLQQVRYKSKSGKQQIDLLLQSSGLNKIPAIYVLYSNEIKNVPCGCEQPETMEGVFFDSAENLYKRYVLTQCGGGKHMPVSCLFACYKGECNYAEPDTECKICRKCKKKKIEMGNGACSPCSEPFQEFMWRQYGVSAHAFPMNSELMPFLFAQTILRKHPEYIVKCLGGQFADSSLLPDQVLVTDYIHRKSNSMATAIMGKNFILDTTRVYCAEDIVPVLREMKNRYGLFERIGLFGSCSRNEADIDSDIDIALIFAASKFDDYSGLRQLGQFIKEIMEIFHKKVDFLDYENAKVKPDSKEFVQSIQQDLIWT